MTIQHPAGDGDIIIHGDHHRARPVGKPRRIIVHVMGEWIAPPGKAPLQAWAFLDSIGLSCHRFVTPSGLIVTQVPDDRMAFHAAGNNSDSLGIELLAPGLFQGVDQLKDRLERYSEEWLWPSAYSALITQVGDWCLDHDLPLTAIERHDELDGTKPDPGPMFPWRAFIRLVGEHISPHLASQREGQGR